MATKAGGVVNVGGDIMDWRHAGRYLLLAIRQVKRGQAGQRGEEKYTKGYAGRALPDDDEDGQTDTGDAPVSAVTQERKGLAQLKGAVPEACTSQVQHQQGGQPHSGDDWNNDFVHEIPGCATV